MKSYIASDLKVLNRWTVYKLLASHMELSRAEIARKSGISTPTILKTIAFFIEAGFVNEAGEGVSSLGRKPQLLRFNAQSRFSIGVEYEGEFLKVGIVNLLGNLQHSVQQRVAGNFNEVMSTQLAPIIHDMLRSSKIAPEKILGVGVGIPAIIDLETKTVSAAPLIGLLSEYNCQELLQKLSEELGLRVYIENDVNAAAMGEFIVRGLTADSDLIYVSLGTGVGAGIVLSGRLHRGRKNYGGEIGFITFDKDYVVSADRLGWLEGRLNNRELSRRWPVFEQLWKGVEWSSVSGAKEYYLFIDSVASDLALCIANINSVLDAGTIVLGGISTKLLGPSLLESVNQYLARICPSGLQCKPQQSSEPSLVGAAMISTEKMLTAIFSDSPI